MGSSREKLCGVSTAVYVLHVFKKKSKRGIKRPKHDIDLIDERLRWAKAEGIRRTG